MGPEVEYARNAPLTRTFGANPVVRTHRLRVRSDLRRHLHGTIDTHHLDMSHETERRGRPFTLVCTKNRASPQRRLADDFGAMRLLLLSTPGNEWMYAYTASATRLRQAVDAGAV